MTKDKGDDAGDAGNAAGTAPGSADSSVAPAATDQSGDQTAGGSGLDNATAALRAAFGDDVVTFWRTSGPRKSHTDEVACVLAEIGDHPRKVIVQTFTSGNYKLFGEVAGKTPDQMIEALRHQYEPAER